MRNLHKIGPSLPEDVRLAAIYWEYYRQNYGGEFKDTLQIGWSPTHPNYIFWDHYNSKHLIDWGWEYAEDTLRQRDKPDHLGYDFTLVNLDDLYPEEIKQWKDFNQGDEDYEEPDEATLEEEDE